MYIFKKIKASKVSKKYGRYVYTLIRVIFEFIFLAGGSVVDIKEARIRADQKGGYAHK